MAESPIEWTQWVDKDGKPTQYFYQFILNLWRRGDGEDSSFVGPLAGLRKEFDDLNKDYYLEVERGNVFGVKIMDGLGERDSIQTTAAGEDIWHGNQLNSTPSAPASHTLIPTPAAAGEQMTVISESDADNGGSATGALTLGIDYLDASGDEQTTSLTMNGQTAVDLTPSDVRFVQDMYVTSVGSNTVAEGNIRIYKKTGDTLVYNMILAGGNKSLVPHRMVPNGKTLYVQKWFPSEKSKAKRITVRLRADCTPDGATRQAGTFLFKATVVLDGTGVPFDLTSKIPAMSIVKVSAWAQVAGAEVGLHWWGFLVDD